MIRFYKQGIYGGTGGRFSVLLHPEQSATVLLYFLQMCCFAEAGGEMTWYFFVETDYS